MSDHIYRGLRIARVWAPFGIVTWVRTPLWFDNLCYRHPQLDRRIALTLYALRQSPRYRYAGRAE